MKRLAFLAAFLPSVALGVTDQTIYVNASCTNNGDGTTSSCAASNGAAGAFNDLKSAVDTSATNLITADKRHVYDIQGSTADTITSAIDLSGYGTGTSITQYPLFQQSGGNISPGYWDTSKSRLSCSGYEGCFIANAKYQWFSHLQMESTRQTDGPGAGIIANSANNAGGLILATGNVIRYNCSSSCTSSSQNAGIFVKNDADVDAVTAIFINNVVYGFQYYGIGAEIASGDTWNFLIYNNTLVDNGVTQLYLVAYATGDLAYLRDNLLQGADSATNYSLESSFTAYTHAKNISEDASSPDASYQSKAVAFANEASHDYRLSSTDTDARDQGDDLSADPSFAFAEDVAGTSRPVNSVWDIGAFEGSVVGGGGGGGSAAPMILNSDL